jgi:alpha-beta hydrolase superfamily lysophospholipase
VTIFAGLVLIGLAGLVVFCFLAAQLLIHPPRRAPSHLTPASVGLPFESVTFASHDGLRLVGWLVGPELRKPPVVVLHGYTDHKGSYLDHARFLFDQGFPTLLYDQRGHGESSPAAVSLGPLEAADVGEALRMLAERELGGRSVVWGVSMGAATALLAAARFAKIQGVIAESSFERLDHVLADTIRLRFHVPSFPIVPLVLAAASLLCKHNLFRVHIGDAVEALGSRPLLLVSGAEDRRMTPEHGRRLLARSSGPTEHLVIAGADHAQCWPLGKVLYSESALRLLHSAGMMGRS